MSETQPIPELNSKVTPFLSTYNELKVSIDYGDKDKFTLEQLEDRARYYILRQLDPEVSPREIEELDILLNRLATEITLRRKELENGE